MKTFKRVISVFLAVVMILGSMSAFATLEDGKDRTLTSQVRFYREVDGEMVETTRVSPDDTVEARIILQSDFVVGTHFLFYLFSNEVFEIDTDRQDDNTLQSYDSNERNGDIYWTGDGTGNVEAMTSAMKANGYLSSDINNTYDALYIYGYMGKSGYFDGVTEYYTIPLKVKETAPVDALATMFLPKETRRTSVDTGSYHNFTYAAKSLNKTENVDVGVLDPIQNPQFWDDDFEIYNLTSTNINTVASAQGYTATQVEENCEFDYNTDKTVTSSFVSVANKVTVNYYLPVAAPAGYVEADEENGETAGVNWSGYVPSRKSGTGTNTLYNYNQDDIPTTSVLTGVAPVVPATTTAMINKTATEYEYGNIQMIPEGYYFAGWAPFDPNSEDPFNPATADLSLMASQAPQSATVAGTSYDYSNSDGKKITAMLAPKTTNDYYVANPNAATMKPMGAAYDDYLVDGELNLIAVILPLPSATIEYNYYYANVDGFYNTDADKTAEIGAEIGDTVTYSDIIAADAIDEGFEVDTDTTAASVTAVDGTVTYDIFLKRSSYKLSYTVDGEAYEGLNDATLVYGAPITLAQDPTKDGYKFSGWDASALDGNETDGYTMPAKDAVVKGTFALDNATITYIVDGVEWESDSATIGSTVTPLTYTGTVPDGYAFHGWYSDEICSTYVADWTMPATGMTVYGKVVADPQEITYVVDGKTWDFDSSYCTDDTVTPLTYTGTVADGYSFDGWYSDENCTEPVADWTMGPDGMTVYGRIIADPQTVYYIVNGETWLNSAGYVTGETVTPLEYDVEKGHTFDGWYSDAECKNKVTDWTMGPDGMVVYGKYTVDEYDINYYDGDELVAGSPFTVTYGEDLECPADLEKEGHEFLGWNTKADGSGNDYDYYDSMPDENLTFYAQWKVLEYTITYTVDGKEYQKVNDVAYGSNIEVIEAPEKEGYTFSGWDTSALNGNETDGFTMPADNVEISGEFVADPQAIEYVVDGETWKLDETTYRTGDEVTPEEYTDTAEGYTFAGWYSDEDCTILVTDWTIGPDGMVVYGKTIANEASIIYYVDGKVWKTDSETYKTGDTVTPETYTPDTGYTFAGWYSDEDCSVDVADWTMPANGMKVYGKTTGEPMILIYYVNGEIWKYDTTSYRVGDPMTFVDYTGLEDGYSFGGWYYDEDFTEEAKDGDLMLYGNVGVYGKVTGDPQTITYVVDGKTWKTDSTSYKTGDTVTPETYTGTIPQNYTFYGWYSDAACENEVADWTMGADGMTVYGKLKGNPATIIYIVDAVDWYTDYTTYHVGDGVRGSSLESFTEAPEGYEFEGWYKDSDYKEKIVVNEILNFDENAFLKVYGRTVPVSQPLTYVVDGTVWKTDYSFKTDREITFDTYTNVADGYTFEGWYSDKDCTVKVGEIVYMTYPGITVYGKVTADPQTITYIVDGEEWLTDSETYKTGDEVIPEEYNAAEGYTFAGWYSDADCTTEVTDWTMGADGMTVYGKVTGNPITIYYYIDGILWATDNTYCTGDEINSNNFKTYTAADGYTFSGWCRDINCQEVIDSDNEFIGVVDSLDIYGKVTADPQTITYVVDGETWKTDSDTYKTDDTVTPETYTDVADGYTFYGWYSDSNCTTEVTNWTMGANGMTVYGKVTADPQPIEYVVDGDIWKTDDTSYKTGDTVAPETYTDVEDGYTFEGWYSDKDCTAEVTDWTMPAGGMTVYGKVTGNPQTIEYVVDGATWKTVDTYKTGDTVTPEEYKADEGYTFDGWFTDSACTIYAADWTMPDGGMKVYGKVTGDSQTIEYIVDGQTWKKDSETYKTGDTVTPETYTDTEDGYTFYGWYSDEECFVPITDWTMPEGGMIVFGVIYPDPQTITYVVDGETWKTDSDTYETGETVTPEEYKADPGYTFAGWYSDSNCTTLVTDWTIGPNGMTVYGKTTADAASVIYYVNGEVWKTVDTYKTGDTIIPEEYAAADGYTFKGWFSDTDCSIAVADWTMPAEGLKVYASYTADKFTLTYTVDGVEYDKVENVATDTEIATIAPPAKDGYTFSGWNTSDLNDGKMPARDAVITGKFIANSYVVKYYIDGNLSEQISTLCGSDVNLAKPTAPEGKTFEGWYSDADCTIAVDTMTMPAKNVDLYGKFTSETKKVTFKGEDGTIIEEIDVPVEGLIDMIDVPEKDGYGEGRWVIEGTETTPETMPTEDIVLVPFYGDAVKTEYTITYLDGDDEVVSFTLYAGDDMEVPADLTKDGYEFKGWFDEDGKQPDDFETMPAGDLMFTAEWDKLSYTITYANTGDTTIADATVEFEADIPAVADPEKAGYKFDGWTVTKTGSTEAYDGTTMPAYNLTYTAKWTEDDFTITYTNTGDSTIAPATVKYNANIPDAGTPGKEGYKFTGWTYADAEGTAYEGTTMPAYNLVATATWEKDTFTVSYKLDADTDYVEPIEVVFEGDVAGTVPTDPPTKDGAKFAGWFDAEGKEPADYESMPAKDVVFTAVFDDDVVYTFNSGEGTFADGSKTKTATSEGGATSVEEMLENAEQPVAPEGKKFKEWVLDEGTTYVAEFEAESYELKFYVDGTLVYETEIDFEDEIDCPADPDNKTGYEFDAWNTAEDGSGDDYDDFDSMPAQNLTFYATWKPVEQTITYVVDGATWKTDSTSYKTEDTITPETYTAAAGYTFSGWYSDEGCTTEVADWTMPAGGMTVYGKTEKNATPKLVPFDENSTAVIERGGVVETNLVTELTASKPNTVTSVNAVDPDNYDYAKYAEDSENYDTWFITGIDISGTVDEAAIRAFVKVTNGGTFTVTPASAGNYGTGTVIKVYDAEGNFVEQFHLVIYGDVNGDALVDGDDITCIDYEFSMITSESEKPWIMKAADVDQNEMLDGDDMTLVDEVFSYIYNLDQATAKIS